MLGVARLKRGRCRNARARERDGMRTRSSERTRGVAFVDDVDLARRRVAHRGCRVSSRDSSTSRAHATVRSREVEKPRKPRNRENKTPKNDTKTPRESAPPNARVANGNPRERARTREVSLGALRKRRQRERRWTDGERRARARARRRRANANAKMVERDRRFRRWRPFLHVTDRPGARAMRWCVTGFSSRATSHKRPLVHGRIERVDARFTRGRRSRARWTSRAIASGKRANARENGG